MRRIQFTFPISFSRTAAHCIGHKPIETQPKEEIASVETKTKAISFRLLDMIILFSQSAQLKGADVICLSTT